MRTKVDLFTHCTPLCTKILHPFTSRPLMHGPQQTACRSLQHWCNQLATDRTLFQDNGIIISAQIVSGWMLLLLLADKKCAGIDFFYLCQLWWRENKESVEPLQGDKFCNIINFATRQTLIIYYVDVYETNTCSLLLCSCNTHNNPPPHPCPLPLPE